VKYSAPEGMHDDIVISLGMLWTAFKRTETFIGFLDVTK